jgi:hypothetical protein
MALGLAAALLVAASQPVLGPPRPPAASPVRLPPLAPGEMLLEVDGIAAAFTPAASARFTVYVYGDGASEEEARRSLDAEVRRVTGIARAAGAAPADVTLTRHGPAGTAALLHVPTRGRPHVLSGSVHIRLRNAAAAQALHERLGGSTDARTPTPVYELADWNAARAEARRLALADARADAEAYAAARGMRIVRTLRVSDRVPIDTARLIATEAALVAESRRRQRMTPHHVATPAIVAVHYVLAPR